MATPPVPPPQSWSAPQPSWTPTGPPISRGHRRWPLALGAVVLCIATAAATAGITWALTRPDADPNPNDAATPTPTYSASEQEAAKERLCETFDLATKDQQGDGNFRLDDGQPNLPKITRTLNSILAVQHSVEPGLSPNVAAAAEEYINTHLAVTTAAFGGTPRAEGERLVEESNKAVRVLVNECGLS